MKVIIDLIEDIREEIGNQEDFVLTAMLLKEDSDDVEKLIYAGEAPITCYHVDTHHRQLVFGVGNNNAAITIGELVKPLLILPMSDMMLTLKMDINAVHTNIDIIGFGKSIEEKKYILFIKL